MALVLKKKTDHTKARTEFKAAPVLKTAKNSKKHAIYLEVYLKPY